MQPFLFKNINLLQIEWALLSNLLIFWMVILMYRSSFISMNDELYINMKNVHRYILEIVTFVKFNPNLFPWLSDRVIRSRRVDSKLSVYVCIYMIPRLQSDERAYFARRQLHLTNYQNIRGNTQP